MGKRKPYVEVSERGAADKASLKILGLVVQTHVFKTPE